LTPYTGFCKFEVKKEKGGGPPQILPLKTKTDLPKKLGVNKRLL
jgi:hypothetical protein